jgi:hypothetical protein
MAKKQSIASEIGSALGAVAARAEQLVSSKPATKTSKPTAKRTSAAKHSKASPSTKTGVAAAPDASVEEKVETEVIVMETSATVFEIDREEIAKEAYLYWEARGYQGGDPADDWARAEEELKRRAMSATA